MRVRRHPEVGSYWSILGVYSQCNAAERDEGRNAYAGYHQIMEDFSHAYGRRIETVAAIFSALSPVNDYWGNLRSMKAILEGTQAGLQAEVITTSTTNRNRQNAYDIALGAAPVTRLKGNKVWNFYNNILDPASPAYVTIDRHALSAWLGRRSIDGRVAHYERVAADYMKAALILGVLPNVVQAVCWLGWKRILNITFDGHPDFFYVGSNLRTNVRVDEVEAFPPKLYKRLAKGEAVIPSILQTSLKI